MRNMQTLNARHRIAEMASVLTQRESAQNGRGSEYWRDAAVEALYALRKIVSSQCFSHPGRVTKDGITAYALTLVQLRECASAAGFTRLMNACDALSVTVSRLIENHGCASRDQCDALIRFVAHAQAMIQMSVGGKTSHAMLISEARIAA